MFGGLGPPELIIIFLIVLLIFGGKKIPEIAKGLGKGIKEFKSAKNEDTKIESQKEENSDDGDSNDSKDKKDNPKNSG